MRLDSGFPSLMFAPFSPSTEYMIQQKRLIAKKLKDYERHKAKEEIEQKRLLEEKKDERVRRFRVEERLKLKCKMGKCLVYY